MKGRLLLWKAGDKQEKDGTRNPMKKTFGGTGKRTRERGGVEKGGGRVERGDALSLEGLCLQEQMDYGESWFKTRGGKVWSLGCRLFSVLHKDTPLASVDACKVPTTLRFTWPKPSQAVERQAFVEAKPQ